MQERSSNRTPEGLLPTRHRAVEPRRVPSTDPWPLGIPVVVRRENSPEDPVADGEKETAKCLFNFR